MCLQEKLCQIILIYFLQMTKKKDKILYKYFKNKYGIIKKKKKKHDKIVLLGKSKLNTIEVLISKVLIDSYISHDELFQ